MGQVTINFTDIEDSAKAAENAKNEINGYISEIRKRITAPIANLPGSDPSGYASTASSLALTKIRALESKASRFKDYATSIRAFASTARAKDHHVSKSIAAAADAVIGKRTWYQRAGDWIFNTFCVDAVNWNGFLRSFGDAVKTGLDYAGDYIDKAVEWFKYGDGKYALNMILSCVAIIGAVAGTIIAIASIPASGGASTPIAIQTVIGCIGAIATAVGSLITITNSVSRFKSNAKAWSLSGHHLIDDDGNPGAARYYGNISKLSEEWAKTDMGDADTNETYEKVGKGVDTTKKVADIVAFMAKIASLGYVKDYRFKEDKVTGYDFSYANIKKNIMHDMGYKVSSGKLDTKKAFGLKGVFQNITSSNYAKKFQRGGEYLIPEGIVKLFTAAKAFDNIYKTGEQVITLDGYFKNPAPTLEQMSKAVESFTGLLSNGKWTKFADDYGTKTGKTIVNILELMYGVAS